ncbi:MAG TPA: NAD-dependent epimerase/dehydratase family protein [Nakamurella sp.]|nr:NAD-dependent epimerase/dehydratase family protein [Nakamurella sp.]
MAGLVVLVTGVTRFIGSELAGRLARHPEVDRVIGVDAALPEPAARARMGDADFARVDIRNPLIARVIEAAHVDTVVHASASATPASSAARSMVKEMNVLGTMQLLAACQRSDSLRNLIVRSTAAVYGSSSRDPAIFTEETPARSVPSSGPARDAIDIEAYVRGFGRRRPDVRIAVPRFADIIGPTVVTPLTRYFALSPFVPMVLGRDARIQLVHESDAVGVMEHLALKDFSGVVNVAGDGVLTLAQAIHRAGRLPLSVPAFTLGGISRVMRTARLGGFSPRQVESLTTGRVLDTTRLVERAGYQPHFTTVEAFDDFAAHLRPALPASTVRGVEKRITGTLGLMPERAGRIGHPLVIGSGGSGSAAGRIGRSATPAGPDAGGPSPEHTPGGSSSGGDTSDGDDRPDGRPRLVGITGDAALPPRRRRTR